MKILGVLGFFFYSSFSLATVLKVGLLSPEGTNWADHLQKMAAEIKSATLGAVELKLYPGGVAGDEADVLRKIRVGQLQGGVFTTRTLGDIYGDVRVVELPFSFKQDRAKAWRSVQKFAPQFDRGLAKNGFKNLGYFELGNVYLVSMKRVASIKDLKGVKIWSWGDDKLIAGLMESLDLISIPLALPDVLPSLSTGIIEAAYASPSAVVALQWQTKIKYLVDFPVAFSLGAFLVSEKSWAQVPVKQQQVIEQIVQKHVAHANLQTISENEQALTALRKNGVEFITFSAHDLGRGEEIRQAVARKLTGPVISQEMMNAFSKASKEL